MTSPSTITSYIDIIRHGQPIGGEVFRGRTDHVLTELGQWQFQQRLRRHRLAYDRIISSPLVRCRASAEEVAEQDSTPITVIEDWQEIDFGDWENKPIAEIMDSQHQHVQQMWQNPLEFCAPNGESVSQLQERLKQVWQQLLADFGGQSLLLVTHGGVMRVLAYQLLGLTPEGMSRLAIPYAGLMRFRVDQTAATDNQPAQQWVSLELLDGESLSKTELSSTDA